MKEVIPKEVIPLELKLSEQLKEKWTSALLYEQAGFNCKAFSIRGAAVQQLCHENKIPIITGNGEHIFDWEKKDWKAVPISKCLLDIPIPVLEKMSNIKDKKPLYVAFPIQKSSDPVLLFELPFQTNHLFIELARWE